MVAGFDRLSHRGSLLNSPLIPLIWVSMNPIVPKPHENLTTCAEPPITIASDPHRKPMEHENGVSNRFWLIMGEGEGGSARLACGALSCLSRFSRKSRPSRLSQAPASRGHVRHAISASSTVRPASSDTGRCLSCGRCRGSRRAGPRSDSRFDNRRPAGDRAVVRIR